MVEDVFVPLGKDDEHSPGYLDLLPSYGEPPRLIHLSHAVHWSISLT